MLKVSENLPEGFFSAGVRDLNRLLGGPTLFYLKGQKEPPLFLSVLLHGNEPVGFEAVQKVLAETNYGGGEKPLPRTLLLFIGNVAAAENGMRRLIDQPDFNRIWPGTPCPPSDETRMLEKVVEIVKRHKPFASVDLHNTTGTNPHYACVNKLETPFLHLASFFSRTVVYFNLPKGVQSLAMADICPAVTLECGKIGDDNGVDHAADYVRTCLKLTEFPGHEVARHDVNLFHTVGRVTLNGETTFSFDDEDADIRFVDDLDRYNFTELPEGTVFGEVKNGKACPLQVEDESGKDVEGDYFTVENGLLKTKAALMPSMLTQDPFVIRTDCLCYVMERLPFGMEAVSGGQERKDRPEADLSSPYPN